ncbi:MAG TPA: 2-hydroxyacid dehydrogenase [Nitrososphaerales archaeon]|nr:2-hydroxyacid dehydrogenase [Nitrososphaerales archaeon]
MTGYTEANALPALEGLAEVHLLESLSPEQLESLAPSVDCLLVAGLWPERLGRDALSRLNRLRFIQLRLAGANHVPVKLIPEGVVICSNAGGFSQGVAEYAWGLLLAAAKRVVVFDANLKAGKFSREFRARVGAEVLLLKGKTLGVIGYGGIGRSVASIGRAFGMEVNAFSRHPEADAGAVIFQGREGLLHVLRTSDAVVLSIPLTNKTAGLIGASELGVMRPGAILVNVAREEIVDEPALYTHLKTNPGFTYATDVWRLVDGAESFSSSVPLLSLDNFVGTPHVSGPSESPTGEPMRLAVENLLRYLRGETPKNVVDRSEYV